MPLANIQIISATFGVLLISLFGKLSILVVAYLIPWRDSSPCSFWAVGRLDFLHLRQGIHLNCPRRKDPSIW